MCWIPGQLTAEHISSPGCKLHVGYDSTMAKWHLKAGIQGAMAVAPRSSDLNRLFQRYVTRSLNPTVERVRAKWGQTHELVSAWRDATGRSGDFAALEVGTGWLPVAPLALLAAGATSVVTLDVQRLLRPAEVRSTLRTVLDGLEAGAIPSQRIDLAQSIQRVTEMPIDTSPERLLAELGIAAVVGDARATELPSRSIDLSVSNNTFEHIPAGDLERILVELRRLCSDDGGSAHFIDLKDHYAGFDPSIGVYNYLRYPARRWRWYNNALQYQNRLRASDYQTIAERAGFAIAHLRTASGLDEDVPDPIAAEFESYERQDLLVHSVWITLLPQATLDRT
jgi:hypothetical protein